MKMKKVLSVLLVTAVVAAMSSGCSQKANTSSSSSAAQVTNISVTYLTMGSTPKDLTAVQDAVNKITVSKIGVKVKFYPIPIGDTFTKYSTLIAGREDIDLMAIAFQGLQSYVNSGSLTALDDYISKNSDVQSFIDDYSITDGAKVDGKTYGIGVTNTLGFQGSVIVNNKYLENSNVTADSDKVYSLDDLTTVFAAIKKANPKIYPLGALGSSLTSGSSNFGFFSVIDNLGATSSSGVLMGTSSTKIVDVYESKDYYNYLKALKEWYKDGYIMPDAATNDTSSTTLMTNGVVGSEIMNDKPAVISSAQSTFGSGATALNTTEIYRASASSSAGIFWTVPNYSTKAEAAVKFLGLTLKNDDLSNLLQWGIEGTHYKVTNKDDGLIDFADGVTAETSGYYDTLGLWGNQNNLYAFSKFCDKAANNDYITKSKANPTKAVGYQYDSSDMTNQLVAVNTVLNQYLPTLETGSEKDLDTTYNAFVKALKAANIDTVIADNQKQFDTFLAK
jgi:putative aldouronate transport system substrate-binding protein